MSGVRALLKRATKRGYFVKDLRDHLDAVESHLDQCGGRCEISEGHLVKMEGLSLSLVNTGGEESDKDLVDDASDEEVEEESSDSDQNENKVEESEGEFDGGYIENGFEEVEEEDELSEIESDDESSTN